MSNLEFQLSDEGEDLGDGRVAGSYNNGGGLKVRQGESMASPDGGLVKSVRRKTPVKTFGVDKGGTRERATFLSDRAMKSLDELVGYVLRNFSQEKHGPYLDVRFKSITKSVIELSDEYIAVGRKVDMEEQGVVSLTKFDRVVCRFLGTI